MTTATTSFVPADPAAILERHAIRRNSGVPTVSLLAGPIGAGAAAWRKWGPAPRRGVVVTNRNPLPFAEWIRSVIEKFDLPAAAVLRLADRAGREQNEFLAAWRTKTATDREQFWNTIAPEMDDDLLRTLASLPPGSATCDSVSIMSNLGERLTPLMIRLLPSAQWPSILFVCGATSDVLAVAPAAAKWALQVPAIPIALIMSGEVWDEFLAVAPESRAKALLKEGLLVVPGMDAATVERSLRAAGITGSALATLSRNRTDPALVEAAVDVAQATAPPPATQAEDDRARSAAERFLFTFLVSLPETAGRFVLNGSLDFRFGPRAAEVDLLCRPLRIAIELDGYFHFLALDSYRRDRTKDWELQRRGFVVLRFLAEDVIPQLEFVRDRILDALAAAHIGAQP